MTHLIDVHVLTHEGTRQDWLAQCLESLRDEPVNTIVIDNAGRSVGAGRASGYAIGTAPFVAYVDSDDYVLPGCFTACLEGLQRHRAVVTLERIEYEDGRVFPFFKPGHSVAVYRREDVTPHLHRMAASPHTTDKHLRALLKPAQLDVLGYVWRVHAGGDHHKTMAAMAKESDQWLVN